MTTVNTSQKSTANLEDLALEVFIASASQHEDVVRDQLDEIKANSAERKNVRDIQKLLAHMRSIEAAHGSALYHGEAAADAQAEWNRTCSEINAIVQSSPFLVKAIGNHEINHIPLDEVKTSLETAASELGDIGQEMQQRLSHAVSLASRHYELGSAVTKKFGETSSAIIRNI